MMSPERKVAMNPTPSSVEVLRRAKTRFHPAAHVRERGGSIAAPRGKTTPQTPSQPAWQGRARFYTCCPPSIHPQLTGQCSSTGHPLPPPSPGIPAISTPASLPLASSAVGRASLPIITFLNRVGATNTALPLPSSPPVPTSLQWGFAATNSFFLMLVLLVQLLRHVHQTAAYANYLFVHCNQITIIFLGMFFLRKGSRFFLEGIFKEGDFLGRKENDVFRIVKIRR